MIKKIILGIKKKAKSVCIENCDEDVVLTKSQQAIV